VGAITTVCPVTGKEIATGIETNAETFARIATITGRVWCPYCQVEHEWSVGAAKFRDNLKGEAP
jgi:hypothetical protein